MAFVMIFCFYGLWNGSAFFKRLIIMKCQIAKYLARFTASDNAVDTASSDGAGAYNLVCCGGVHARRMAATLFNQFGIVK